MLKRLKHEGITIVVSTPYMDEATMCDRIALIQSGKILTIERPEVIVSSYADQLYAVKAGHMYSLLKALNRFDQTINSYAYGEYAHVSFREPTTEHDVVEFLTSQGLANIEMHRTTPTIEDCFIKLLKSS